MERRKTQRHLIFISYRRGGAAGYAGRVYDALNSVRRFRGRVFLDVYSIEPSEDFAEAVRRAAGSCRVMIVLIDRGWLGRPDGASRLSDPNDFVRREVEAALGRNITVLPVCIDDAPVPGPGQLPASIRGLADRQAVALRHDQWHEGMRRLFTALDRAAGSPVRDFLALSLKAAAVALPTLVVPNGLLIWFWMNVVASYYREMNSLDSILTEPAVFVQLGALQALSVSAYSCAWVALYRRLRRRAGANTDGRGAAAPADGREPRTD